MQTIKIILCSGLLMLVCACSHSGTVTTQSSAQQEGMLDFNNVMGERIQLPGEYPAQITQLILNVHFPQGHELLVEAAPNIEFYSADGHLALKRTLDLNTHNYVVNQRIDVPCFYLKLGIYYCKTGDAGLCMIQNVLYEVHTSEAIAPGPLDIEYTVPGSNI